MRGRPTSWPQFAAASFFSAALFTGTVLSALILDQSTGLTTSFGGNFGLAVLPTQSVGQSVTTGMSGLLAQVDVQIYKNTGTVGDVRLDILPMSGGFPDETSPLLTRTISINDIVTKVPLTTVFKSDGPQ
jgi:hypothetical protein